MKDKELICTENHNSNTSEDGNPEKRLYRSQNKIILGVCAGIAEFFNIDPIIIRLLAVFFTLAGMGSGIATYIIAAIIIPKKPTDQG